LKVLGCPSLSNYLGRLSSQGYEVCAGLERLGTDDYSFLATSFCKCLTSLRRLKFCEPKGEVARLSLELQQLRSCTTLEELVVYDCQSLAALEGKFTCLKKLVLKFNSGLESLQLDSCTALEMTIERCKSLPALEGNFTSLKELVLRGNSGLASLQLYSCTMLEALMIEDCDSLTALGEFHLPPEITTTGKPNAEIHTAVFLHSTGRLADSLLWIARCARGLPVPQRSQVFESIRLP